METSTDWKGVNHGITDIRNEKIKSFLRRSCNLSKATADFFFFYKAFSNPV